VTTGAIYNPQIPPHLGSAAQCNVLYPYDFLPFEKNAFRYAVQYPPGRIAMHVEPSSVPAPTISSRRHSYFCSLCQLLCFATLIAAVSALFIPNDRAVCMGVIFQRSAVSILTDSSGLFVQVVVYPTAVPVTQKLLPPHIVSSPAVFSEAEFHNAIPHYVAPFLWASWDPCGGYVIGVHNVLAISLALCCLLCLSRYTSCTLMGLARVQ
jgi:hypothetical protein